jgi:hypothetical protein
MLSIFKDKASDEFVTSLVQDISRRYPPQIANDPKRRISPDRLTSILETAFQRAQQFVRDRKLGAFGKARLANSFRWALGDVGYSKSFVEIATEGLVVYTTARLKSTPADTKK